MSEKTILVDLNLKQNSLKNSVFENLAIAPSSPVKGQVYYSTALEKLCYWDGTTWIAGSIYTVDNASTTGKSLISSSTDGNFVFRTLDSNTTNITLTEVGGKILLNFNISAGDVGLGSVNNTSDKLKPLSDAAVSANTNLQNNINTVSSGLATANTAAAALKTRVTATELVANAAKSASTTNAANISSNDTDIANLQTATSTTLPGLMDSKITDFETHINLGTVAHLNHGTSAGQVPVLNSNGKLADSIMPSISLLDSYVVADIAERDALDVQVGDIVVVQSDNYTYILQSSSPKNWIKIQTPLADVTQAQVTQWIADAKLDILGAGVNVDYNSLYKLQVKLIALTTQVSANTTKGATNATNITTNAGKITANTNSITALNTRVGLTDTTGLSKRIKDNETNIAANTNNLVHTYTKIASTTANVMTISKDTHKCGANPIVVTYLNGLEVITNVTINSIGQITVGWNSTLSGTDVLKVVVMGK